MASTYSTNLKIELIGTGEQSGTWGVTTNTNLGTALEQSIVGKADVAMSSTTVTLTLTNTNAAQDARAIYLNLTGSPGGAAVLEVPAIEKPYIVKNGSDQVVTVKVTGQTGVAVPVGKTMWLYNNGTDVTDAIDNLNSNTTINGAVVGYRNIPAIADKTAAYTLATGDVGKVVGVGSGGSIEIPDATFAAGDAVLVFNNTTGDVTITCTITTAYIAGADADVASVTLSTRGVANILFLSGTACVLTGNIA